MNDSRTFFKNTLMTISRQVSAILIGLLYTVIIARALGPGGNGMYQIIILLPTMLLTILNLGIGSASVYSLGKKKYDLHTVAKSNTFLGLVLGVFSILIGVIFILVLGDKFFKDVPLLYAYSILVLMPFLFLNEYYIVLFQAKEDFKNFNLLALVRQLVALFSIIIFLIALKYDLLGAILSFYFGVIAQFILTCYLLVSKLDVKFTKGKLSKEYVYQSLSFGIKAHASNILSSINYRADMFIISYFINPVAVGIYTAAVSIAERLWIVSQSISSVLFPKVSSIDSEEQKNELTSMLSRNVFALSLISGFFFYLLSDLFIFILFGDEYQSSSLILKILLPGIILFSVDRILSNDLAGRGKPEINMKVSFFTVVSNIILNLILVPVYGLEGSAFATSFTYSLSTIIKIIIFNKSTSTPILKLIVLQNTDLQMYKNLAKRVRVRG